MARILVQITTGPEHATKAALGFLVAKTAIDEGHEVTIFVVGDAVLLLRPEVVKELHGVGTGALSKHIAALDALGARVFYSGLSARARGLTEEHIAIGRAEAAMPDRLVALAVEADTVLTY